MILIHALNPSSCHISPHTLSPLGSQRGGIVQALPFHHFGNWPIDNWLMVILSYLQRQKLPSLKRRTVKASRVNYMLLKFPFTQPYTMASKQKKKVSFLPVLSHCRFGLPCQVQKELDSFFKWCGTKALEWGMVPGQDCHSAEPRPLFALKTERLEKNR